MVKYFQISDFLYSLIGFAPMIGAEDNKVIIRAMKVTSWKRFLIYFGTIISISVLRSKATRKNTERNLYFLCQ